MTWEQHLFGNDEHVGLVPKLQARAKIIHRLSHMIPLNRLNLIAEGIFFSILNYCIEVYGNVWGLSIYNEQSRTNTALTREDNMKLQVLVNKVLRSLTGLGQ